MKLGYKQTEMGVIPKEWEVKPLGEVLKKGRLGGNYPNQLRETDYPLMKMGNIARGYMDTTKIEYITRGVTPDRQHKLTSGDVLFNTRNTLDLVGKVAIWRDELPLAYYNSNLMRLEFDPRQVCSNEYANAALNASRAIAALRGLATGTTSVAAIYTRDLLGLPFVKPPLPEQRAIAEALSDVDALLGALNRLIAKKRDLKQAAMQQLLTGQTRLPGFHGEWEMKRLGDNIDLLTGFPFPSEHYSGSGVRLLRGSNVKRGETDWNEELVQYWPKITSELQRYQLQAGDLVIAMDGSLVGRSYARLKPSDLPAVLLQRVARIRSKTIDISFLTQIVGSKHFVEYCDSVKTVTAIPHISSSDIRNFELTLPATLPEQTAIAEVLSDMDAELSALEQRREKTRALKQGMMQELLTGRTRLFS